jgi:hypothetical protein
MMGNTVANICRMEEVWDGKTSARSEVGFALSFLLLFLIKKKNTKNKKKTLDRTKR